MYRSIEERHYTKYFIIDFLINNYKIFLSSDPCWCLGAAIREFIVRINELVTTDDQIEKLIQFKNEFQCFIQNGSNPYLLVYFAVKDFITDKRLDLLYIMRDKGLKECMDKYMQDGRRLWRIKDVILNTKWKYENEAYDHSNPIIDQLNKKEYKNIKEASKVSGVSEEEIKKNFGYHKRWIYISSYIQFQNSLPVEIINRFSPLRRVFKNIKEAPKHTSTSEKNIRYFINKGGYFETHGMQRAFR